jgi:hypothetical protein
MALDIEKYRHYVAGFDLSPEEQAELIRTVWMVLESFVDQAYGRHPHQHCRRKLEFKDLQDPIDLLESKTSKVSDETPRPKPDH